MRFVLLVLSASLCNFLPAQLIAKPSVPALPALLPEPRDHAFRGALQLRVDATDTDHGIFRVTESIPVQATGDLVLLYPQWETTSHAPTGSAVELAGLTMQIDGKAVEWHRDLLNVYAFHLIVLKDAHTLLVTFDYLAPSSDNVLRPDMVVIPWSRVLLYPAGWFARDIIVAAKLQLRPDLRPYTALAFRETSSGVLTFNPETLDRLVDAPVYAARYSRQIELSNAPNVPIHLDLVADNPDSLSILPAQTMALKALIQQTSKVFGPPPFRHYDVLVSLSDDLSPGGGQEHLDEGENNLPANYLSAPSIGNQDLIAHEYVHAWNGRFRQPADLWSPNFNRPVDPSMLWVYEGQTEFWGRILAARAGMRTAQETLDMLALDASLVSNRSGRSWKSLADSTLDVLYMPHHAVSWRDWQRREDYYPEGVLLWLDVDARLRELSHENYGVDDFAHRFFATHGAVEAVSTYSFKDVCSTLNSIAPDDWKTFLEQHLLTHSTEVAMRGLARSGWKLTYSNIPTKAFLEDEADAGEINLDTSLGLQIRSNGTVRSVVWNGPAFRAGLAPGVQILTVNGNAFTRNAILEATSASTSAPVHLELRNGSLKRGATLPYAGPLRYPHLERLDETLDRLTSLMTPR
jgi:predicted metalloprotease with PDZ domain